MSPNGVARYEFRNWHSDEWIPRAAPARITARLVTTYTERFDRFTGSNRGAYNPHSKARRLVAYRLDGGEWVTIERGYTDLSVRGEA